VAWAKAHLKAAGLLDNPGWGRVRLSDEGRRVLDQGLEVDTNFLRQFPTYLAFIGQTESESNTAGGPEEPAVPNSQ
jgi:restriction system protein